MNGLQESAEPSMRRSPEFPENRPEFPENHPKFPENHPEFPENRWGDPKPGPLWNQEPDFHLQEAGTVLRLRLPGEPRPKQKPVGRAFAMVAKRTSGNSLTSECVKSNEGDEEIIKVYLKARADHEEPMTQLKSEVRHIQEAGSALKKLREDLSTKLQTRTEFQEFQEFQEFREFREFREFQEHSEVFLEKQNGNCSCPERLRGNSHQDPEDEDAAPKLLQRLQEAEKRHQLERKSWELAAARLREEAEMESARAGMELERLRGILGAREEEQRDLRARLESQQSELERLREREGERAAQEERSAQLEKEVASLREKIHHLDDMLKSQQRKVRHMIEQLQNAKTVIQAKDAAIQELKERVSYLEAENLEMHDRIEHLIERQVSPGGNGNRGRSKSESGGSKRLPGLKPLPLIRVVET